VHTKATESVATTASDCQTPSALNYDSVLFIPPYHSMGGRPSLLCLSHFLSIFFVR